MKFLVFDNQPGLGTTRELILNWDNVKSIKPISTDTFSIILNNKASLMFKMQVGTAKDVVDVINRLLTTSRGKVLKVKPATIGGFKFDNIAYIANSITPSHIGQSDNMFGSEDNPINAVSTGFLQLAKNPTQVNTPSYSSNSTIEAFQIVKVDVEAKWGGGAWITQIHDLINSGKDILKLTINIGGTDETHTLPAGIWTIEYWNGYDNLRISTPQANWPFTGTSTAGINYGTNVQLV